MRLATPDAVLAVLGIQTGTGSLAAAGAALDATFPVIESRLETSLVRARYRDVFDLAKSDTTYAVLRLSHAFVAQDESTLVSVQGVTLTGAQYRTQHRLGLVSLLGTFPQGQGVVTVEYSAGFDATVADPKMFLDLPDALVQGGTSMAAHYLLLNPANSPKEKARFLGQNSLAGLELKAIQSLAPFVRPRATVVWPVFSEAVE